MFFDEKAGGRDVWMEGNGENKGVFGSRDRIGWGRARLAFWMRKLSFILKIKGFWRMMLARDGDFTGFSERGDRMRTGFRGGDGLPLGRQIATTFGNAAPPPRNKNRAVSPLNVAPGCYPFALRMNGMPPPVRNGPGPKGGES